MAMLVFYERLKKEHADRLLKEICTFFEQHRRRRVMTVGLGDPGRTIRVQRGQEADAVREIAAVGWKP